MCIEDKLIKIISLILVEMGIEYNELIIKDGRFNKYLPFKLSERRTLCYIQYENRTIPSDQFNFVIRFKRNDNPLDWNCYLSQNELFLSFIENYSIPWSQQSGYPRYTWDDSGPTQQFAFTFCDSDIQNSDFKEVLRFMLEVSFSAVKRNWDDYNTLTSS